MPRFWRRFLFIAVTIAMLGGSLAQGQTHQETAGPLAGLSLAGDTLVWQPHVAWAKAVLSVSGPGGLLRREFAPDEAISLSLLDQQGQPLPDGGYAYQLHFAPKLDQQTREQLAAAGQDERAELVERLRREGKLPAEPLVQGGSFAMSRGQALFGSGTQEQAAEGQPASGDTTNEPAAPNDQVVPDDLIVQGSACVGFDCASGENFGFDTIRMKENNLRIKFEDTSLGGFPTTDWQLTANDSESGGLDKFSIEDITGAKIPFTIRAGARNNSIYVDSSGRVGFGTATPDLDLHVSTDNTPALRLEQTNAGGFTSHTWDVAGNEANFFIRDLTGGNRLPFRIRPGAPTSSIDIAANGNVGLGTATPEEKLHVNGNILVEGNIYEHSDEAVKEHFAPVGAQEILARVAQLKILTWNYKSEDDSVRHIGPTAQDFHAAFGLGASDKYIAPLDTNGVALAAIQGLYELAQSQQTRIEELERDNAELEERLERLEELVGELSDQ